MTGNTVQANTTVAELAVVIQSLPQLHEVKTNNGHSHQIEQEGNQGIQKVQGSKKS